MFTSHGLFSALFGLIPAAHRLSPAAPASLRLTPLQAFSMSAQGSSSKDPAPAAGAVFAPGVPSPSLQSTKAQIDLHIQHMVGHRHALELQLEEVQVTERWLRALRCHIVARDLNEQFGADLAVAPLLLCAPTEEKTVKTSAPPPVALSEHLPPPARQSPVAAPPLPSHVSRNVCKACYNEARGKPPSAAHTRNKNGQHCRLDPALMRGAKRQRGAEGAAAAMQAAQEAVDRSKSVGEQAPSVAALLLGRGAAGQQGPAAGSSGAAVPAEEIQLVGDDSDDGEEGGGAHAGSMEAEGGASAPQEPVSQDSDVWWAGLYSDA